MLSGDKWVVSVVILPPYGDGGRVLAMDTYRISLRHASRKLPRKLSTTPFCIGTPGAMNRQSTLAPWIIGDRQVVIFQLYPSNVASESPQFRQISAVLTPAFCRFNIPMICSSSNRERFLLPPSRCESSQQKSGMNSRPQSSPDNRCESKSRITFKRTVHRSRRQKRKKLLDA